MIIFLFIAYWCKNRGIWCFVWQSWWCVWRGFQSAGQLQTDTFGWISGYRWRVHYVMNLNCTKGSLLSESLMLIKKKLQNQNHKQEIWISYLLLWAGNSNFLPRHIFLSHIALSDKKLLLSAHVIRRCQLISIVFKFGLNFANGAKRWKCVILKVKKIL